MKFLIKKYKNLNPITKFVFWLSHAIIVIMSSFLLLSYKGWHIPTDDEIHYSQGKIYVVESSYTQRIGGAKSVGHIELHTNDGKKMYFTCSYTAFNYTQYSNCGNNEEYKNMVHRKYGEVGWYVQKPILWIKNPYPQMVSLAIEKDGVFIDETTQDETIHHMLISKKGTIFLIIFNIIGSYGIFFFAYLVNKPKQTKE